MRVTIIADASYCPFSGAAGYGYWIACERGKRGGGGPMMRLMDGSGSAEMAGVVNALYAGIRNGLVQDGDHILLQTDCQSALDAFSGLRSTLSKDEREAKKRIYGLKREHKLTFTFRHVKGHSSVQEARYITNNLCDVRAKAGMRFARQAVAHYQGEAK